MSNTNSFIVIKMDHKILGTFSLDHYQRKAKINAEGINIQV